MQGARALAFRRGLSPLGVAGSGPVSTATATAVNSRVAARRPTMVEARPRMRLVRDDPATPTAPSMHDRFSIPELDQVIEGDCVDVLNGYGEAWADLVFADPPFNIGYLYHGYDDQKSVDEYVDWSEQWMRAVHRALKPTGSFYLAIGDEFAADLCVAARRRVGFTLRNWIVWHYTFGQQTRRKFAKSHTHILYFTKSASSKPDAFTFNADAVRVKSARQTTYTDARANPKGKVPDDTWFLRPQEASLFEPSYRAVHDAMLKTKLPQGDAAVADFFAGEGDTWNVSRVCGTFKEREGWHGCQMPIAVLDRVIKASSNVGDVVLDPFHGSGTTGVSAALNGRRFVGVEQSPAYAEFGRKRIAGALAARDARDEQRGVFHIDRATRVQTETDAFGRPRVKRPRKGA